MGARAGPGAGLLAAEQAGGGVNDLIREALYPYPDDLAIVSKVGAGRDAGDALLRS
jgi:hypothetical protein